MKAHDSTITAICFDPTGTLLATCSEDSLVKVSLSLINLDLDSEY